jgi:HSP20 family molecular chaperone IbpA
MSMLQEQQKPLVKWVIALCVLLLTVLVLQAVILVRTNALVEARRQGSDAQPQEHRRPLIAAITQKPPSPKPLPPMGPAPGEDPWAAHVNMLNDMQALFDRFDLMFPAPVSFRSTPRLGRFDQGWDMVMTTPTMDMREADSNYVVVLNLPTANPNDTSVTLDGRILTVSSTTTTRQHGSEQTKAFETRIQIPGPAGDLQQARAVLTNGILRITIPKSHQNEQSQALTKLL